MSHTISYAFLFIIGILVASTIIYTTPLRYLQVVEPIIDDIEPIEFYEQFRTNPDGYVFIDVRSKDSYDKLHAEGSLNIPLVQLSTEREYLPKRDKDIVLICSGGRASGIAYSYLEHYGFFNLKRIAGGVEAWEEAGLPVEETIEESD